jgi:hypothetical protein
VGCKATKEKQDLDKIRTALKLHIGQSMKENEIEQKYAQKQRFEITPTVPPRIHDGVQHTHDTKHPNISAGNNSIVMANISMMGTGVKGRYVRSLALHIPRIKSQPFE